MFKELKETIKEIAKNAVIVAEQNLGGGKGEAKKELAIKFIVDNLPVPAVFKGAIAFIFRKIIDECIELAVAKLKTITNS